MIVSNGNNLMAALLAGEAVGLPLYIAIGSGYPTLPPVPQDTALQNEIFRKQVSSINRVDNQLVFVADFGTNEGSGTLSEAGLFNAASGGTMFARWLIEETPVKSANGPFRVTWTVAIDGA